MNIVSRGVRNAFRNWVRSGSIIVILSLSIGLVIAMLVARQAVTDKINTVKSSIGNTVSISPAGSRGFEGGGNALTGDQMTKVAAIGHVTSVSSSLGDRLVTGTSTNLESSMDLGNLGQRRASENGSAGGFGSMSESSGYGGRQLAGGINPTIPVSVTGINDASDPTVWGGSNVTWVSGRAFDPTSSDNIAVVGKGIATKNNLSVGSMFTAYSTEVKVVGIYDAGTEFANNGVFMPLATLQTLSSQTGSVTSAIAHVDSVDNVAAVTTAVQQQLGSAADVTNSQTAAENAIKPLESVQSVALFSLIGALVAGSVVILLTMIMIVRERRREIGVMKAIGSSSLGVAVQFVAESVTMTVISLVVGVFIGVAAATPLTNALVSSSTSTESAATPISGMRANSAFQRGSRALGNFGRTSSDTVRNITSSVGPVTIIYGIGAMLLMAVVGSAIPAIMISKVKPAEAMRSE